MDRLAVDFRWLEGIAGLSRITKVHGNAWDITKYHEQVEAFFLPQSFQKLKQTGFQFWGISKLKSTKDPQKCSVFRDLVSRTVSYRLQTPISYQSDTGTHLHAKMLREPPSIKMD